MRVSGLSNASQAPSACLSCSLSRITSYWRASNETSAAAADDDDDDVDDDEADAAADTLFA